MDECVLSWVAVLFRPQNFKKAYLRAKAPSAFCGAVPDAKASGYLILARDRKAYLRAKAPSAFCGAVRPDAKASGRLIRAGISFAARRFSELREFALG